MDENLIELEIKKVNNFLQRLRHTLITEPDGRVFNLMSDYYDKVTGAPKVPQSLQRRVAD